MARKPTAVLIMHNHQGEATASTPIPCYRIPLEDGEKVDDAIRRGIGLANIRPGTPIYTTTDARLDEWDTTPNIEKVSAKSS